MVKFLYKTILGRAILKILTRPTLSRVAGCFMDSRLSAVYINRFIKKNNISLDDFEIESWKSFNHFFTRKVKPDARSFSSADTDFVSPCDGLLTVYPITDDLVFTVKNSEYSIASLLENKMPADKYKNGTCLVFRLTPTHYHRYHYFDSGYKTTNTKISGILHTVQPIAVENLPVYSRNSREYTTLHTDNFGDVIFMEVGALLVGRIVNYHNSCSFSKGEEKGKFEFGGSTIILLFENNKVNIDSTVLENNAKGIEFPVKAGQKLGTSIM
ncbi:MAG: phosphatidylserine decarboxylase [Ruminococcaceae bacterium]|nr:phosphatidylserine decarboxylase [Oscillospiraceae bacterium]